MNIFNRVFLTILFIALACAAVAVIALAWTAPQESIDALRDSVAWLDRNHGDSEKSFVTAVGALVILGAWLLLYFELKPRSGSEVMVTDLQGGQAFLSTTSISQRVEEAVAQVAHVYDAKATVTPKRKGVAVSLDLHVDPDANIASVTEEACNAAREVLTNRVHVALVEPPHARLHYRSRGRPDAAPSARPRPGPPSPPPAPDEAPPLSRAAAPRARTEPANGAEEEASTPAARREGV